jgi:hypothetical protein
MKLKGTAFGGPGKENECELSFSHQFDSKKLILKGYLPGDKCRFLKEVPLEFMKAGDKK